MRFLQKLPGSRREPPGLERRVLAKLPIFLTAGTAIPALCYLIAPLFHESALNLERHLTGVGIYAIAVVLTVWTTAFTVAIGCIIVMIMKGPAYVADRYPLSDAEEPRRESVKIGRRPPPDRHS